MCLVHSAWPLCDLWLGAVLSAGCMWSRFTYLLCVASRGPEFVEPAPRGRKLCWIWVGGQNQVTRCPCPSMCWVYVHVVCVWGSISSIVYTHIMKVFHVHLYPLGNTLSMVQFPSATLRRGWGLKRTDLWLRGTLILVDPLFCFQFVNFCSIPFNVFGCLLFLAPYLVLALVFLSANVFKTVHLLCSMFHPWILISLNIKLTRFPLWFSFWSVFY